MTFACTIQLFRSCILVECKVRKATANLGHDTPPPSCVAHAPVARVESISCTVLYECTVYKYCRVQYCAVGRLSSGYYPSLTSGYDASLQQVIILL
jgi:hypothetical protein